MGNEIFGMSVCIEQHTTQARMYIERTEMPTETKDGWVSYVIAQYAELETRLLEEIEFDKLYILVNETLKTTKTNERMDK